MKSTLTVLANPFIVLLVSMLIGLAATVSPNELKSSELITIAVPVVFIIFSAPLVMLSLITRAKVKNTSQQLRLIGMWVGAFTASTLWIGSLVTASDGQSGLGLIFVGCAILAGGLAGYLFFWLVSTGRH